jgi:molybdenum cofactor cytidylyltransferase
MNSMNACGIYLAAGSSSRMGENKLALPFGKTTIGSSALRAALDSTLDHVIIVAKQDDPLRWIDNRFFQQPFSNKWTLARCHDAASGQAYSLKCGLEAAGKRNPDSIMVILADQPFLPVKTIDDLIFLGEQMIKNKENSNTAFIASGFQEQQRPPILFFQQFIPYLLELHGDEGARQLFRKESLQGITVEMKDENIFIDVDTKEDYRKSILLAKRDNIV